MKMKTRTVSLLLIFWAMSLALPAWAQMPSDGRPRVSPPQGRLIGEYAERNNQVAVYKGIPFAAPPIGQYRWQPPQPPASWSGEREADSFGPNCM